jgi:hypothetical protein
METLQERKGGAKYMVEFLPLSTLGPDQQTVDGKNARKLRAKFILWSDRGSIGQIIFLWRNHRPEIVPDNLTDTIVEDYLRKWEARKLKAGCDDDLDADDYLKLIDEELVPN